MVLRHENIIRILTRFQRLYCELKLLKIINLPTHVFTTVASEILIVTLF